MTSDSPYCYLSLPLRALVTASHNNMAYSLLIIASLLGLGHCQLNSPSERLTDSCLGCICEAISGCNLTRGCVEDDCGMFRITRLYWVDAGQPTLQLDDPTTDGAYQRCVVDPVCAARTVRGYMAKFIEKDCNGDGQVDCMDYAASHFNGGFTCSNPLDLDYAKEMRNCLAQVAKLSNVKP